MKEEIPEEIVEPYRQEGAIPGENEILFGDWYTLNTEKFEKGVDFLELDYQGRTYVVSLNKHPNEIFEKSLVEKKNNRIFVKKVKEGLAKKVRERLETPINIKNDIANYEIRQASKNPDLTEMP